MRSGLPVLLLSIAACSATSNHSFAWIENIEQHGGVHMLEAQTYFLDRQYKLPDDTTIIGAGSGSGQSSTIIKAVATKPEQQGGEYNGCGGQSVNRQGFVLGSRNYIGHLHYIGFDTVRWPDNKILCGGAPFETPGCSTAYCDELNSSDVGGGVGVHDSMVEDVTVEKDTTQTAFWMPQTRSIPCRNVTLRGLETNGTWADGVNIHGSHAGVLVEGCIVSNTGDDTYAIWSHNADIDNITFANNFAGNPRYPANSDGRGVSCFAVYGGSHLTFVGNRCVGTGTKGMINFQADFNGLFSPSSSTVAVTNNSVDEGSPVCGGVSLDEVNAPGCHHAAVARPAHERAVLQEMGAAGRVQEGGTQKPSRGGDDNSNDAFLPGWVLTWSDEFDGEALDTTKWNTYDQQIHGDAELQLYRAREVSVGGGLLTINTRHDPCE
jgi:hypothetical protein